MSSPLRAMKHGFLILIWLGPAGLGPMRSQAALNIEQARMARTRKLMRLLSIQPETKLLVLHAGDTDKAAGGRRYDLILLDRAYSDLYDRVDYFKRLKNFLTPKGLLAVADFKSFVLSFAVPPRDWSDTERLREELLQEPADSPLRRHMRPRTWNLLQHPTGDVSEETMTAVLSDFNSRILPNPQFSQESLLSKPPDQTAEEASYTAQLREDLERVKAFNRNWNALIWPEQWAILRLNKLLLVQRFRPLLVQGGQAPYLSLSLNESHSLRSRTMRKEIEHAGYRLQEEHEFPPFEGLWLFAPL